jgi:hypothetical protein
MTTATQSDRRAVEPADRQRETRDKAESPHGTFAPVLAPTDRRSWR